MDLANSARDSSFLMIFCRQVASRCLHSMTGWRQAVASIPLTEDKKMRQSRECLLSWTTLHHKCSSVSLFIRNQSALPLNICLLVYTSMHLSVYHYVVSVHPSISLSLPTSVGLSAPSFPVLLLLNHHKFQATQSQRAHLYKQVSMDAVQLHVNVGFTRMTLTDLQKKQLVCKIIVK